MKDNRTKKEKASSRNWTKLRLLGIVIDTRNLTSKEQKLYSEILELKDEILQEWDKSTEEHLETKLKPYKCHFCSRRSNIKRTIKWGGMDIYNKSKVTVCLKHFKEFN